MPVYGRELMAKYLNLRIAAELGERLKPHAKALEWTPNHFAEHCVELICAMIESPEARVVPEIVAMIDARSNVIASPMALEAKFAKWQQSQSQSQLRAAEDHPQTRRKI